jgi:uncharacterized protein with FMN-binding domain
VRRSPIVLTATIAGVAAIVGFHAREPGLPSAAASAAPAAGSTGSSGATATTGSSGTTSGSTAKTTGTRTATGDAIPTQYGNAQVRVTVTDGKITKIEALQLQGNDPKSAQISAAAEPQLRQSALTKQSAAVDTVSGATYTSASYEQSLQSALDKLGFKAADGSRGTAAIPQGGDDHDGGGDRGAQDPTQGLFG